MTPVPGLQGVPLGLNANGSDATNPALWNAVWLHFEGATYELDNIEVGSGLARAHEYGSGCGSPALGLRGVDRPVLGAVASAETYAIPSNATAEFLFYGLSPLDPGLDLTPIAMPGCYLQLNYTGQLNFPISGATHLTMVPIPISPLLAGASLYLQSVVAAQGATPFGLISSNGLRWILDVR